MLCKFDADRRVPSVSEGNVSGIFVVDGILIDELKLLPDLGEGAVVVALLAEYSQPRHVGKADDCLRTVALHNVHANLLVCLLGYALLHERV